MKIRNGETDLEDYFDLDVLRGWREVDDEALRAKHRLPVLAELVRIEDGERSAGRLVIHGPDVILGRFQPQHGPVDLAPGELADHENYKLGVPHLYLRFDEIKGWEIRLLTLTTTTKLDGVLIEDTTRHYGLRRGSQLELGVVRFVFEPLAHGIEGLEAWMQARQMLLEETDEAAIYLKRNGGICGPSLRLVAGTTSVIGRTAPRKGEIPGTAGWRTVAELAGQEFVGQESAGQDLESREPVMLEPVMWDLAGLEEGQRKHIGFCHAKVYFIHGRWCVEPISQRQWTFVNRVRVRGRTPLKTGDEIGLGSVLFHFQDPRSTAPVGARSLDVLHRDMIVLPDVFNWYEGHVSAPSASSAPREKADWERER